MTQNETSVSVASSPTSSGSLVGGGGGSAAAAVAGCRSSTTAIDSNSQGSTSASVVVSAVAAAAAAAETLNKGAFCIDALLKDHGHQQQHVEQVAGELLSGAGGPAGATPQLRPPPPSAD